MKKDFNAMNAKKRKCETQVLIGGGAVAVAIILGLAIYSNPDLEYLMFIAFIVGPIGALIAIFGLGSFNKIKKDFKVNVLKSIFEEKLPGTTYNPFTGLDRGIVTETGFLKRPDRFHSEDFISGTFEEVDFVSSDIKLEERHVQHTKNGTRVYYVTYFLGRIFEFNFNKDFVGELLVLEAGAPRGRFRFDRIKLESIDFNKKFKTYSTNDLTAFYILTPDIMEAIFKLERRNPGTLGLSFHDGKLYVAINNNKNTFELQMFRKIDQSVLDEFVRDFLVIKDLIITMKLNNKLFKK